jgi:hypothetical protein
MMLSNSLTTSSLWNTCRLKHSNIHKHNVCEEEQRAYACSTRSRPHACMHTSPRMVHACG